MFEMVVIEKRDRALRTEYKFGNRLLLDCFSHLQNER